MCASQCIMRKRTGVRRSTLGAATQPISPPESWRSLAGETASEVLESASLDEPLISCPLPPVGCWGSLLAGCTLLARRRPPSGAATWRVQCRLESEQPERSDGITRPYQHNRPSLFYLSIYLWRRMGDMTVQYFWGGYLLPVNTHVSSPRFSVPWANSTRVRSGKRSPSAW